MDRKVGQPCRLCFAFGKSHIQIFKESFRIVETIQEIFHCEVSEFDLLPNSVCVDCWMTTEKFHKFYQQVKSAQNEWLLQAIVKTEMNNDDLRPERETMPSNHSNEDFASFEMTSEPATHSMDQTKTKETNSKELIIPIGQRNEKKSQIDTSEENIAVKKSDPLNQYENMTESDADEAYNDSDPEDGDFQASASEDESSSSSSDNCSEISSDNDDDDGSSKGARYGKNYGLRAKKVSPANTSRNTVSGLGQKRKRYASTKQHKCDECEKSFTRPDRLRNHRKLRHSFKCDVCKMGLPSQKKLNGHLKTHDKNYQTILKEKINSLDQIDVGILTEAMKNEIISKHFDMTCDVCKAQLESLQHAKTHYVSEHSTLGYVKCCNMIFRDEHVTKEHVLLHLNPELFRCPICDEIVKTKSNLRVHLNNHANIETVWLPCQFCGVKFENQRNLTEHVMRRHTKPEDVFKCQFCDRSFLTEVKFEKHMRNKHATLSADKEKMLESFDMSCDLCETHFKSLPEAKSHYWDEHNNANGYIKCCEVKFKKIEAVNEHINFHLNPDIFKCKICEKTHKSKQNLKSHLSTHKQSHVCDKCGESFSRKYRLERHKRKHAFECNYCSKNFQSRTKMEAHLKTHDKDAQERIKEAIEAVNQIDTDNVSETEIQQIMSTNFDMKCDVCGIKLESLEQAKAHHLNEHKTLKGYLKCCNMKFREENAIKEHVVYHFKPDLFRCFICNETSKVKNHLKIHLNNHASETMHRKYGCDICGRNFSQKPGLVDHIVRRHTTSENKFKCKLCDKCYVNEDKLNKHMWRMHELISAQKNKNMMEIFDMTCDECGILFESLLHAQQHYLKEHKIPNGYIKCCEFKFKSLRHVEQHIEWHGNPQIYKCEVCSKEFKIGDHLKNHMPTHTRIYSCDKCHKRFKRRYTLNSHYQNVHENPNREFQCRFCLLRFYTEEKRHTHEQVVHYRSTTDARIMCEICGKGFIQEGHLRLHMKSNHSENQPIKVSPVEEREMCTICGLWLPNRYRLKLHRKLHKLQPHKCDQCDLEAPNQEALICHIRAFHKDRRKHKCRLCDQSFNDASELQEHASSHSGEKLYQCDYCTDSFIWRASLTAHKKKLHPSEWSLEQVVKRMKTK